MRNSRLRHETIRLQVHRNNVVCNDSICRLRPFRHYSSQLQQACLQIMDVEPECLTKRMVVTFADEAGIDAGGPLRELFYLLFVDAFRPECSGVWMMWRRTQCFLLKLKALSLPFRPF